MEHVLSESDCLFAIRKVHAVSKLFDEPEYMESIILSDDIDTFQTLVNDFGGFKELQTILTLTENLTDQIPGDGDKMKKFIQKHQDKFLTILSSDINISHDDDNPFG